MRTIVRIDLGRSAHPAGWGHERRALVMGRPGTLHARFTLASAGAWDVWVQGEHHADGLAERRRARARDDLRRS